jgi:cold shock CspA family protein
LNPLIEGKDMPTRVYDIAVKLGLENKQVLAKAKELGIAAARVASSSLDKITAEYLEDALRAGVPKVAAGQTPETVTQTQAPQPSPVAANGQLGRSTGIVIQTSDLAVQDLLERVLSGEVPFTIEFSREGLPELRARLVPVEPPPTPDGRAKADALPRADLDERTKDLFRAAYYSARHVSKDDWVNMAEYGNALKRQDPTFQPQDFGERSLGGLVRRMIDDFDVKADNSNPVPVYYIRLKHPATSPAAAKFGVPTPPTVSQPRRQATGKIHNLKLGFGFIAPDDGSENVFFHASEVVGCTIFDLRPGDPVEFEAGVNERGACAWKVRRLGSGSEARGV